MQVTCQAVTSTEVAINDILQLEPYVLHLHNTSIVYISILIYTILSVADIWSHGLSGHMTLVSTKRLCCIRKLSHLIVL